MSDGFYKRRRGVLEHLRSGKISLFDCAVHDFLCLIADYRSGLAWASAEKICNLCPRGASLRTFQRSFKHLEKIGWIKRFRNRHQKGNYPVIISRFSVTHLVTQKDGSVSPIEMRVNAERTTDWRDIQYDPVTQKDESVSPIVSPGMVPKCHPTVAQGGTSSRSKNREDKKEEEEDGQTRKHKNRRPRRLKGMFKSRKLQSWIRTRILLRAKGFVRTPVAYVEAALPDFDLPTETEEFLIEQLQTFLTSRLQENPKNFVPRRDIEELLWKKVQEYDLPADGAMLGRSVRAASDRLNLVEKSLADLDPTGAKPS